MSKSSGERSPRPPIPPWSLQKVFFRFLGLAGSRKKAVLVVVENRFDCVGMNERMELYDCTVNTAWQRKLATRPRLSEALQPMLLGRTLRSAVDGVGLKCSGRCFDHEELLLLPVKHISSRLVISDIFTSCRNFGRHPDTRSACSR